MKLTIVPTVKMNIVKAIPEGNNVERGAYKKYWKGLKKTPKGEFLEVVAPTKKQKLIANYIYYRARKSRKKIGIAFRLKAMYAFWK